MAAKAKDYYAILGLTRDADEKQIKQAYRRLARKHHPDLNPSDRAAEEKFKEIQEAYDVLSDPEKRSRFDRYGHLGDAWRYAQPGPGGVPAKMYPSPLPVPAHVGHHYHTYPPLYPHEFMYHHTRAWYTYHPGAGWTRTKAYYHTGGGLWDVLSHMKRF